MGLLSRELEQSTMIPVASYSSINRKRTFRGINYKSNGKARSVTTAKATPKFTCVGEKRKSN